MCFRFSQSQLSNLARSTRICARSLVPSDQIQTITNSSALSLIVFQLPSFAFTKPSNSRSWGCSRVLSCRLVRPVQASSSIQTWTEQPLTLAQALKHSIGFLLEYVQLVFVFFQNHFLTHSENSHGNWNFSSQIQSHTHTQIRSHSHGFAWLFLDFCSSRTRSRSLLNQTIALFFLLLVANMYNRITFWVTVLSSCLLLTLNGVVEKKDSFF